MPELSLIQIASLSATAISMVGVFVVWYCARAIRKYMRVIQRSLEFIHAAEVQAKAAADEAQQYLYRLRNDPHLQP